ncbi:MAG: glutamine amidotransferase [Solirubrobacteraceae bacterium]
MPRVLIVGESWITQSTHIKGFDQFESSAYHTGVDPLRDALSAAGHEVVHLAAHSVAAELPDSRAGLDHYDVIILSDIGADTILLSPRTFLEGQITTNRLAVMRDWVMAGGGLAMAGGYLSFQGIGGRARYHRTPVEEVLPCTIDPWDDRVEVPEGAVASVVEHDHSILSGVPSDWPALLGYNRVHLREDALLLARFDGDPILAIREPGAGRTLIWTSDIGPHWCPESFLTWTGYATLWSQAVSWLARPE